MPAHKKSEKNDSEKQSLRDPYDVLGVSRSSTDQEIKSAYRKLALKYHPNKNANDPKATDMFNEITFSYNILSDPDKRHQYDTAGFEVIFNDYTLHLPPGAIFYRRNHIETLEKHSAPKFWKNFEMGRIYIND